MKRADYQLIGKIISGLRGEVKNTDCPVKVLVWGNFAPRLKEANANFDEQKFRKACGV